MKNIYKNILDFLLLIIIVVLLVIVVTNYKNECFCKLNIMKPEFTHPATW
jgi:hypothetical protein